MKVVCIVPAAGRGKRLGCREEKPFVKLKGKPLLSHTLDALEKCPFIDEIIVVVSVTRVDACRSLVGKYKHRKVRAIVRGGKRRFDSVKNGLAVVENADFVLIHDGARPLVDTEVVRRVFCAARRYGAALAATLSKQTVKLADKNRFVKRTPERQLLWEAQTPQGFKGDLIKKAYERSGTGEATDDSVLVERLGYKVKIVRGSSRNIKITTSEDLELAEVLLKHDA